MLDMTCNSSQNCCLNHPYKDKNDEKDRETMGPRQAIHNNCMLVKYYVRGRENWNSFSTERKHMKRGD
jgi:hypothetical protein